jgi:hypothetical protein
MPIPTQAVSTGDVLPANLLAKATDPPPDLESDRFPDERSFVGKRALIPLVRFLIVFCIGVGATLAWQSYAAREMIASSYPQLSGLAPQTEPVAQSEPDAIGLASPVASYPDQQQPNATLLDLDALRQTIDRIATGIASSQGRMTSSADRMATTQEQIARSIDRIATSQEQIARGVDQIAPSQGQIARSVDQLTADQEQMTREITKLQEIRQSARSKTSEPSMRPASGSAPKPVSRPASASAPKPVSSTPTLPEPTGP